MLSASTAWNDEACIIPSFSKKRLGRGFLLCKWNISLCKRLFFCKAFVAKMPQSGTEVRNMRGWPKPSLSVGECRLSLWQGTVGAATKGIGWLPGKYSGSHKVDQTGGRKPLLSAESILTALKWWCCKHKKTVKNNTNIIVYSNIIIILRYANLVPKWALVLLKAFGSL